MNRGYMRYVPPAAFLVAVIVLISLLAASGVLGGDGGPVTRESATTVREIGGSSTTKATATTRATTGTTQGQPTPTTAATTTTTSGQTYVVEPGDSPVSIAERYGVSVTRLMEFNDIEDPMNLRVGQVLRIPPAD